MARKWTLGQRVPPLSRYFFGQYLHLHSILPLARLKYLVSGSSSGIWLNTQQVRGLASLAWSCSGSTGGDNEGGGDDGGGGNNEEGGDDKGVLSTKYSEKEPWEDIVIKAE